MSIVNQNFKPVTDPNINSVFADMLPIVRANPQYLNAYLLTGSPTEKLAAAMIKDMPQTKQAPPAQAPAQSVIDRMAGDTAGVAALQQPQMNAAPVDQGGLAELPLPDTMFNEESYAGGGIIAFEDGGDVPRYDGRFGSTVMLDDPDGKQKDIARKYTEAKKRFLAGRMGRDEYYSLTKGLKNQSDSLISNSLDTAGVSPLSSTQIYNRALDDSFLGVAGDAIGDANSLVQRGAGYLFDKAASVPSGILESLKDQQYVYNPATDGAIKVGDKRVQDARANQPKRNIGFDVEGATAVPDLRNQLGRQDRSASSFLSNLPNSQGVPMNVASSTEVGRGRAQPDLGGTQSGMGGAEEAYRPVGIKGLEPTSYSTDTAGFDALMPKEQSVRQYANEFRQELGDDPGRAALKENLAKMRATGEKEARIAPGLALAEAGFAIAAGDSQFALQNIAAGGVKGIQAFAAARDNLRRAEERRFDLEAKVAQSERAEQLAAINYGSESKRTDDVARRTIGLAKQSDIAREKEVNALGKFNAEKFNLEYAQKEKEIKLADKRIDKQIQSTESQTTKYELANQRDSLKTALNELNDMIKNEQSALNPDPNKIAALQGKFDSAYNALYALATQSGSRAPAGNMGALDPAGLTAFDRR